MNPFKGWHFQRDIILWAVRWYCKYGVSYRELQETLAERGISVDHTTIYLWVQRYAPEIAPGLASAFRLQLMAYIKVNGRWAAGTGPLIFTSPGAVTASGISFSRKDFK